MEKPKYQITNEHIYEKYTAEVGSQQSKSTQATDKNILTILSNFVKKPYTEITKDDIVKLINALTHGTLLSSRGKTYGPYSVVIFKAQLMKFFKWLYNWEKGQALPEQIAFLKLNVKRAYKLKTIADCLTEDEVKILIDTAKTPRNKAIISVLYDSGIRAGETSTSEKQDEGFSLYFIVPMIAIIIVIIIVVLFKTGILYFEEESVKEDTTKKEETSKTDKDS